MGGGEKKQAGTGQRSLGMEEDCIRSHGREGTVALEEEEEEENNNNNNNLKMASWK
jgi:hypothetical protein